MRLEAGTWCRLCIAAPSAFAGTSSGGSAWRQASDADAVSVQVSDAASIVAVWECASHSASALSAAAVVGQAHIGRAYRRRIDH